MNKFRHILLFCIMFLIVLGVFSTTGAESEFKDTPYFTGMPNYEIWGAYDKEFDEYTFCDEKKPVKLEGGWFFRQFSLSSQ